MSAIAQYKPEYIKYYRYRSQEPYFLQPSERLAIKNVASLLPAESFIQSGIPKALALAYLGSAAYSAYTEAERAKEERAKLAREAQEKQLLRLTQTQSTLDEIKDIQARQALAIESQTRKLLSGEDPSQDMPGSGEAEEAEEVEVIDEPPINKDSMKKADIKAYVRYTAAKDDFNPTVMSPKERGKSVTIDLDVPFTRRFVYDRATERRPYIDDAVRAMIDDIKARGYDAAFNDPNNRMVKDYFDPINLLKKIMNPVVYIPRAISEILLPAHKKLITNPTIRPNTEYVNEYGEMAGEIDEETREMYLNDLIRASRKSPYLDPEKNPEEHAIEKLANIRDRIESEYVDYRE